MAICILSVFILALVAPLLHKIIGNRLDFLLSRALSIIFIHLLHKSISGASNPISESEEWTFYFRLWAYQIDIYEKTGIT